MPNITRGGNTPRLLRYLVGRGRREEHLQPHLVAGQPAGMLVEHGARTLDRGAAAALAALLDEPMKRFGTRVTAAVRDGEGRPSGDRKDVHVWHCSLALHPTEPDLDDGVWAEIAARYVATMGFDPQDGRPACRWLAIRHGRSAGDSDHIHIVINLVREDGTKAGVHLDRPRAQQACGELERRFGLRVLESRDRGTGERGVKAAEVKPPGRDGDRGVDGHTPRRQLERIVRACATAAADERDFVERLREEGVLLRARFVEGGSAEVSGYSVALRPPGGTRPVWFGGGRLSRELTLPRLRAGWPVVAAGEVAATWRPRQRPTAAHRTTQAPGPAEQADVARQLAELRGRLADVRHEDHNSWATVSRDVAGILAAWSLRTEPLPGPLAEAGRVIARGSQQRASRMPDRPHRALAPTQAAARMLIRGGLTRPGGQALMIEISSLAASIADMHRAAGEAQRASELETAAVLRVRSLPAHARRDAPPPPRLSLGPPGPAQRDGEPER